MDQCPNTVRPALLYTTATDGPQEPAEQRSGQRMHARISCHLGVGQRELQVFSTGCSAMALTRRGRVLRCARHSPFGMDLNGRATA